MTWSRTSRRGGRGAWRRLLFALGVLGTLTTGMRARADEAPPTILILCEPQDRLGLQVLAELEALGLHAVVRAPAAEPASRAALEAAARDAGAMAAIRAVPSARGVEVWIADRVTGKTVLREMASDGTPERDASLALRVVELLRASLLEVTLPSPPKGEVPAPPEVREKLQVPAVPLAGEPPPTLRVSLAAGALLSPGGFGPLASLDLGLAWMPSEHVGLFAFTAIPVSAAHFARPEGSVDLRVLFAGGGVRLLFTGRAARWAPTVDLGLMGVSLHSTGTPSAGLRAESDAAAAPAPFARFGVAAAVTPLFRLRADVLSGVIVQGVSLHFAGQEVARWGQPFALLTAGADFGWF